MGNLLPYRPVAFGKSGVDALNLWLDLAETGGRSIQVITDIRTDLSSVWNGDVIRICEPDPLGVSPLTKAGWLKIASTRYGPAIVCDCDWFPLAYIPWENMGFGFGMATDPGKRMHHGYLVGFERNSGVLVFHDSPNVTCGSKSHSCLQIIELYLEAVLVMRNAYPELTQFSSCDEIATTRVWELFSGRFDLPVNCNQSHWSRRDLDCFSSALHFHGCEKLTYSRAMINRVKSAKRSRNRIGA